jgi:hypothetical protein
VRTKPSRGWGFKIDYARAIADDEASIRWAELSIARGWYRRSWPYDDPALGSYETTELWQLILYVGAPGKVPVSGTCFAGIGGLADAPARDSCPVATHLA